MQTATVTTTGKKVITTAAVKVAADNYEDCPICGLSHPHLIHNFNPSYEADIISTVKKDFPAWETKQGICGRCFDRFEAVTYHPYRAPKISVEAFKQKHFDFYILPIAARLMQMKLLQAKALPFVLLIAAFIFIPTLKKG